jgi:hypothetical protein
MVWDRSEKPTLRPRSWAELTLMVISNNSNQNHFKQLWSPTAKSVLNKLYTHINLR